LIRKYVIGVSDNQAVVWARVDWCAADEAKQVLFSEAFYATATVHLIGSLGGVKDRVNQAAVKRIAQNALMLAANAKPAEGPVAGTYLDFDAATASIPNMLETWGLPFFMQVAPQMTLLNGPKAKSAADTEPINWQKRLNAAQ
jgi:hypothetical protein